MKRVHQLRLQPSQNIEEAAKQETNKGSVFRVSFISQCFTDINDLFWYVISSYSSKNLKLLGMQWWSGNRGWLISYLSRQNNVHRIPGFILTVFSYFLSYLDICVLYIHSRKQYIENENFYILICCKRSHCKYRADFNVRIRQKEYYYRCIYYNNSIKSFTSVWWIKSETNHHGFTTFRSCGIVTRFKITIVVCLLRIKTLHLFRPYLKSMLPLFTLDRA